MATLVDDSTVNSSKALLKRLALFLGIISLGFAGLFTLTSFSKNEQEIVSTYNTPSQQAVEQEEGESAEEKTAREDMVRYVTRQHTVVGGESFSLITGKYWDDIYLWPDLYLLNDMQSADPDLIIVDENVDIYNRLGSGDNYSSKETSQILEAYIEVYDRFKSLGEHKNNSAWTLLWCGTKYDRNFLNKYADRILPKDLAMARKYINESGYLD